MISIKNEEKKFLFLNKIKTKNNHKFIKCLFIIILTILLLIEKFESENTSIFSVNKKDNKQNNTNLYNNKVNDIKGKDNNQKEKDLNKAKFNKESNDKNDNNSQKGNPGEIAFKTLNESFNSAKDFLDKGIKGILIQDKQKFILSENPIVSAVIPLYNCKNVILRTLVQSKIKIYII